MPSSVVELQSGWIGGATKLEKIEIFKNGQENIMKLKNGVIIGKSDISSDIFDDLIFVPRDLDSVEIPSFISIIHSLAFSNCIIEKVVIPQKVTIIGDSAFLKCQKLLTVEISHDSSLHTIESSAFKRSSIKYFFVPLHVTKIGDHAFSGCSELLIIILNFKY